MKKITQQDIKQILGCEIATVSRYLTGARQIKLKDALEVREKLNIPVEIFTDPKIQFQYFGKSFVNNTKDSSSCTTTS